MVVESRSFVAEDAAAAGAPAEAGCVDAEAAAVVAAAAIANAAEQEGYSVSDVVTEPDYTGHAATLVVHTVVGV